MLINDLKYFKTSANYSNTTSGIDDPLDHPDKYNFSTEDWHAYPIQDFDYQFNSWGFRGPEYTQYIGKPVNICLGDSFTVNVGGPIEHSWCSKLAQHFNIPTLNLGMDGAGNDAIKLVYDRACDLFDVQNTFVMYSYFHRRLVDKEFIHVGCLDNKENFSYFLQHRLNNAIECALPYWNYDQQELDFLKHNNILFFFKLDTKKYEHLRGQDWPTYEQYVKGVAAHQPEILQEMKQQNFYYDYETFTNRDGHHMNQQTNKIYADYFHNQWKMKNEP
mgnify:CR=1 FL=1